MSRAQQLPHVRSEPAPDSSKRGLPLARAVPVYDVGYASGKVDLRKGNKLLCNSSWERAVRKCEKNSPADTKVSAEGES